MSGKTDGEAEGTGAHLPSGDMDRGKPTVSGKLLTPVEEAATSAQRRMLSSTLAARVGSCASSKLNVCNSPSLRQHRISGGAPVSILLPLRTKQVPAGISRPTTSTWPRAGTTGNGDVLRTHNRVSCRVGPKPLQIPGITSIAGSSRIVVDKEISFRQGPSPTALDHTFFAG